MRTVRRHDHVVHETLAQGAVGHLQSLYLTWSPYHYAAQSFGLSAMYCYRSGCKLGETERRLLWWTCMLPFLHAFVTGNASGLGWFVPESVFTQLPALDAARGALTVGLKVLTFGLPVVLVWRVQRSSDPSVLQG